jgi:hypothetical protein
LCQTRNKQNKIPPPKTYVFVTVAVVVVLALGAVLFMRVLCVVVGGVRAVLTRVGMLFVVVRGMRAILTLVVMTVAVVMIVVLLKIIYLLFIIKLAKYSVIYVNEIIRDRHTHITLLTHLLFLFIHQGRVNTHRAVDLKGVNPQKLRHWDVCVLAANDFGGGVDRYSNNRIRLKSVDDSVTK